MKKFSCVILLLFVFVIVSKAQLQVKKAAIISVFGNKNLSDDPLDTKIYEKLLNDTSFSITHTVDEFERVLKDVVVPKFPFPFADKSEIVTNEDYQNLDPKKMRYVSEQGDSSGWASINNLVTAKDYMAISGFGLAKDTDLILKMYEIFPDLDAVMIGYIDFNLIVESGIGGLQNKKVGANCHIAVYDKEGKKLFRMRESAKSDDGVMSLGGFITDVSKLKPMIRSAADNLIEDLKGGKVDKKISKMIKKSMK